jgi:hypothetical protein
MATSYTEASQKPSPYNEAPPTHNHQSVEPINFISAQLLLYVLSLFLHLLETKWPT